MDSIVIFYGVGIIAGDLSVQAIIRWCLYD
jgi:hypothetical protein